MGRAGEDVLLACVTWNSARHVASFIDSLRAGLEGVDKWRLVVVDNGSADETVRIVRSHCPTAIVIENEWNAGYAGGINAALALLGPASDLVVCNPDVRLGPGCVRQLLDAFREPGVGIACPLQRGPDGAVLPTLRSEPSVRRALGEAILGGRRAGKLPGWGELEMRPSAYTFAHSVAWATGSLLAVSAGCLRAVGPWDERYFLYSEETDFALRARDKGYAVRFVPGAVCTHETGESHESPMLWALLTVNRARLFRVRHSAWSSAAFRGALLLGETMRSLGAGGEVHRCAVRLLLTSSAGLQRHIGALRAGPASFPHLVHKA
ncbi:glycosyl transferase family 2 [Intrasporangium chromatireducens Q5-1]|uniref:Glycosyl transferase family 2 n=1 Tax=Intrasporangium chromatireducens Q5-1 TaxID=584657 RepID=W9GGT0_9MICO|nr:glycosyltransferase family 2 protein [Intrasporangium chromatireducens]EWT05290.1 glycosyl transferase family 2 [Intrasporangium chromatireducens Q5-1]